LNQRQHDRRIASVLIDFLTSRLALFFELLINFVYAGLIKYLKSFTLLAQFMSEIGAERAEWL